MATSVLLHWSPSVVFSLQEAYRQIHAKLHPYRKQQKPILLSGHIDTNVLQPTVFLTEIHLLLLVCI